MAKFLEAARGVWINAAMVERFFPEQSEVLHRKLWTAVMPDGTTYKLDGSVREGDWNERNVIPALPETYVVIPFSKSNGLVYDEVLKTPVVAWQINEGGWAAPITLDVPNDGTNAILFPDGRVQEGENAIWDTATDWLNTQEEERLREEERTRITQESNK